MQFKRLANSILDHNNPGLHNQAVMEFGAIQCIPVNPDCSHCTLSISCYALKYNMVKVLPVKKAPVRIKERYFNYLVITSGNKIFLRKRTKNDIWKMLYEFPLIETPAKESENEIINSSDWKEMFDKADNFRILNTSRLYKHFLTHQRIYARFFRIEVDISHDLFAKECIPVDIRLLQKYAVPKLIERYLLDNLMLPL
jgi:A/G-specific adenine glycosylase